MEELGPPMGIAPVLAKHYDIAERFMADFETLVEECREKKRRKTLSISRT